MSSAARGLVPREGLGSVLMKMGRAGPPCEPRRRPQAGRSGDPRSQNADSSPRAQGAPGLGHAGRRKGKSKAPRALTACGLGRRMAVDWTWAPQQPCELIREWHLSRLCFFCFLRLLLRSPFLRLSFLQSFQIYSDCVTQEAMAPRQSLAGAWYSSALDSSNVWRRASPGCAGWRRRGASMGRRCSKPAPPPLRVKGAPSIRYS